MATFTNQATLTYRNQVVTSNVVTGEIVGVLSATKNALVDSYTAGSVITYIISIINSGSSDVTGVEVTDDLGAYEFGQNTLVPLTYVEGSIAYYRDGILQADPEVTAGPSLSVEGITVPANGNAMLIYQVTVNEYAPLGEGGEITNTAVITGPSVCDDVVATETISTEDQALLSIEKALSPLTVTEGGELTYTFIVRNFGNIDAVATDDLVITDTFDPILDPITVTYNGTLWTEGEQYTYNEETGEFATIAGNITVPAATYTQNPVTGEWAITPGESVIEVVGTVQCPATSTSSAKGE